jgi:hypothetical protein
MGKFYFGRELHIRCPLELISDFSDESGLFEFEWVILRPDLQIQN